MASGTTFGAWLRNRRRNAKITQRDLASQLGRNQSVIARWESDDLNVTPHDLVALAGVLNFEPAIALAAVSTPAASRRRSSAHWTNLQRGRTASRIASLRAAAGLTEVQLSRETAISPYRLWKIESGSDPSLAELAALVRRLGPEVLPSLDEAHKSRP